MKESLDLINSNKIYKKIFLEVYSKYKKYGKITGSFTLKAATTEERQILFNFDSKALTEGKAKIKCSTVRDLFNRKLKEYSFEELLVKVVGKELKTNKEVKDEEKEQEEKFYDDILKASDDGVGKQWFIEILDKKKYGYNIIVRKYKSEIRNLKELKRKIILIINSLNKLPYLNNEYENIAVFSAVNTKDSHFFDSDKFTGRLFIKAISFILNKDDPKDINEINELYYEVGILKDEISNHTTIYGLNAFNMDSSEVKAVNSFNLWKEPLQISISNLLKIDYFEAINNTVFIFENPAVFHKILKVNGDNISLICTSGQLNLSSYILLNKIRNLKNIYYSGDFDPEGLMIAYKIKKRYKDKVKFLNYTRESYINTMSNNIIEEKSMSQLNKINCSELDEVINELRINKRAAYQELLIDEYLDLIKKVINYDFSKHDTTKRTSQGNR
ncbi:TIGR02679 domain-containing protein [uncultured Clostridium sp.]|uniref:TIGR02679 domain-containing protein n=1 Tax=uncultured Clostridium sp. TaxID=59620 RepID=UPI002672B623|nr:TIGR02679 domain-containing protein [uncultured Clostridium sp.]